MTYPSYLNTPVFNEAPNWRYPVRPGTVKPYELFRNIGTDHAETHLFNAGMTFKLGYTIYGKENIQNVIDFFDARRGRYGGFWIPSWQSDVVINRPFIGTDEIIYIEDIKYPDYWLPNPGKGRFLYFKSHYGSEVYAHVKYDSIEYTSLNLTRPISAECSADSLKYLQVSFLWLVRFAQDEVLLDYITPSTVVFNFIFVVASDHYPWEMGPGESPPPYPPDPTPPVPPPTPPWPPDPCELDPAGPLELDCPETIEQDICVMLSATGGYPPYSYSVSGVDFSIVDGDQLCTSDEACGSATVTVTDYCGNTDTQDVRCGNGTWSPIPWKCVIPGVPTEGGDTRTEGKYKMYQYYTLYGYAVCDISDPCYCEAGVEPYIPSEDINPHYCLDIGCNWYGLSGWVWHPTLQCCDVIYPGGIQRGYVYYASAEDPTGNRTLYEWVCV